MTEGWPGWVRGGMCSAAVSNVESSERILREKDPPVKGLSAETAAAVERGELEIVDDDE